MFGLNNSNWHGDGIDWIGDAIESVGYHCGFEYKPIELKIKSFRCVIPSCIESIEYIYHNGIRLPLGVDKSDYGFVRQHSGSKPNILTDREVLELSKQIDRLNELREMDIAQPGVADAIGDAIFQINGMVGTACLAGDINGVYRHHFYNIEDGTEYIKTSFESGTIIVHVRAFKVDLEGYPLVINTFKYKEYVSWFLISRLLLSGEVHPVLTWEKAEKKIDEDKLLTQAQNEPKMLSIDQMERFKNRWTSIKRDVTLARY